MNKRDDQHGAPVSGAADRWPRCPRCNQPRHTACPVCQSAGRDFPPAELAVPIEPLRPSRGPAAAGDQARQSETASDLLVCPTCDEVFAPRYYRFCPACEYDFGSGVEPPTTPDEEELPQRAVLVALALILLTALLLLYFGFMLSGEE